MRNKLSFIPSVVAALLLIVCAVAFFAVPAQAAIILTSFTATPGDQKATIQWSTANEINISYFNLYRRVSGGSFSRIAGPIAHTASGVNGASYPYTDNGLSNGVTYEYQLEVITTDNNSILTGVISVYIGPTPTPSLTKTTVTVTDTYTYTVSPTGTQVTVTGTPPTATKTLTRTPYSNWSYLPGIWGGLTLTPTKTNTPVKTYTPTRTRTYTVTPYRSPTSYIYRTATRMASTTPRTATPSRTATLSTSAAKTATILALTPRTATLTPSRTMTLSTSGAMTATILAKTPRTATMTLSTSQALTATVLAQTPRTPTSALSMNAQTSTAMALLGTPSAGTLTQQAAAEKITATLTTPTPRLSATPSLTPEPTPSPTPTPISLLRRVLYKGFSLWLGFITGLILLALAIIFYIWWKRRQKAKTD